MEFFSHEMGKDGLEHLTLTEKIQGRRGRGRRRQTCMESFCSWIEEQLSDDVKKSVTVLSVSKASEERIWWRTIIVEVLRGLGT